MELLNAKEAAGKLKISVRRLHELCRKRKLGFVDFGRKDRKFTPQMIQEFISCRLITTPKPKPIDNRSAKRLPSPLKGGRNLTEDSGRNLIEEIKRLCR